MTFSDIDKCFIEFVNFHYIHFQTSIKLWKLKTQFCKKSWIFRFVYSQLKIDFSIRKIFVIPPEHLSFQYSWESEIRKKKQKNARVSFHGGKQVEIKI